MIHHRMVDTQLEVKSMSPHRIVPCQLPTKLMKPSKRMKMKQIVASKGKCISRSHNRESSNSKSTAREGTPISLEEKSLMI